MTLKKILPLGLILLGVLFLAQIAIPIVTYKIWEAANLKDVPLVSPKSSYMPGISISKSEGFPFFVSTLKRATVTPYPEFLLTVPKIDMAEVAVYVDSNDLDKGLVHLPGSALPGEKGNVFISGHSSVLFSSNFSKLPILKTGDEIKVKIGQTEVTYKVVGIKVVEPTDVSVISPPDTEGRFLTLMTCVPPGLNLKRLIVLAELI